MEQDKRLQEAVMFFSNSGYLRLLQGLADKYRSLGRLGGSVKLDGLTDGEREAIGLLLRRDLSGSRTVTVTYAQFAQAIADSRFHGIDELALLQRVLGTSLLSKREERERLADGWNRMMSELLAGCHQRGDEAGARWVEHLAERGAGARHLVSWFEAEPERLQQVLDVVLQAIASLPDEAYERLPIYAARVTRDPHAFDRDRDEGKLLLQALVFLKQERDPGYQPDQPLSAEQASELLYEYGLLRDDILNFVTCSGIVALRDGSRVAWWEHAAREHVALHVPLRELVLADTFVAYGDEAKVPGSDGRRVYIVENSSVYADLLDRVKRAGVVVPLVCTGGQLHIAAWHLLDKLAANGYELYYSGDFDPEGLLMAQRLRLRYRERLRPWRYSVHDYERCLSEVGLSDTRLKQLQAVEDPELVPVRERMQELRSAGYQEQLIEELAVDIGSIASQ